MLIVNKLSYLLFAKSVNHSLPKLTLNFVHSFLFLMTATLTQGFVIHSLERRCIPFVCQTGIYFTHYEVLILMD